MKETTRMIAEELYRKGLSNEFDENGFADHGKAIWWLNDRFDAEIVAIIGEDWYVKNTPNTLLAMIRDTKPDLDESQLKFAWAEHEGFREISPLEDRRYEAEMSLWWRCVSNYGEELGNMIYDFLYPLCFPKDA